MIEYSSSSDSMHDLLAAFDRDVLKAAKQSFSLLQSAIQRKDVIHLTSNMLAAAMTAASDDGCTAAALGPAQQALPQLNGSATTTPSAKVFLIAVMMATYPDQMFLQDASQQSHEQMKHSSKDLLLSFTAWKGGVSSAQQQGDSKEPLARFATALKEFNTAFAQWSQDNKQAILEEMIDEYTKWSEMLASMEDQDEALAEWSPEVSAYQAKIQKRLESLGGAQALAQLESRLNELKLKAAAPLPLADQNGNAAPNAAKGGSAPSSSSLLQGGGALAELPAASNEAVQQGDQNQHDALLKTNIAQRAINNVQIAHETFLDSSFDFESLMQMSGRSLEEISKERRTLIDSLRISGSNQNANADAIPLFMAALARIKSKLLDMIPEEGQTSCEINEHLDIDHLTQELESGVTDISQVFGYVIDKMALFCAPIRDDMIKELYAKSDDPAEQIAAIFDALDVMHTDIGNFLLKNIRPMLLNNIIPSERADFELYRSTLKAGSAKAAVQQKQHNAALATMAHDDDLPLTSVWLTTIHRCLQLDEAEKAAIAEDPTKGSGEFVNNGEPRSSTLPTLPAASSPAAALPGGASKHYEIFIEGVLALLGVPSDAISKQMPNAATLASLKSAEMAMLSSPLLLPLPETFYLDERRIKQCANQITLQCRISAIAIILRNLVPKRMMVVQQQQQAKAAEKTPLPSSSAAATPDSATSAFDQLTSRLKATLSDESLQGDNAAMAQSIKDEIKSQLMLNSSEVSPEIAKIIEHAVDRVISGKDNVLGLVRRRISALLRLHLLTGSAKKPSVLAGQGLEYILDEFQALSGNVYAFVQLHRNVHAPLYDALINQILALPALASSKMSL